MSDASKLTDKAAEMLNKISEIEVDFAQLTTELTSFASRPEAQGDSFLMTGLTIFVLACFVGYYVVWRVTPALHSPLMGLTNAISSVIIVGALLAAGPVDMTISKFMGFLAIVLASVNIFGGFIVTRRMLHMFKKKG